MHTIILAWGVHLLTASGAVWCLLAIEAAVRSDWRGAFLWLIAAVFVDAIDGTLARLVRVKDVLPNFDGTLLDNIIDYLSYVIVPVVMLPRMGLIEPAISFWLAAAICLASAFQFCRADAKTADQTFTGFPSYWNVVLLYLLIFDLGPNVNAAILAFLIVMVFVPIRYLYPTRSPRFLRLTVLLSAIWSAMILVMVWQLPSPNMPLVYSSLVYVGYYVAMSGFLMLQPQREADHTEIVFSDNS
ncbi:MAG: CDP-diacylglycerol O-phosphatidyltransferase [Planctomycetota bacterium]|nr:CDP-diacylglycerol O-phosphatidyltransferase [Planctomycetota bacterium]